MSSELAQGKASNRDKSRLEPYDALKANALQDERPQATASADQGPPGDAACGGHGNGGCNGHRRTFCKICIGGMSVLSAAMVGYPIVSFMARPHKLGAGKPVEVPLDRLSVGQAQYVEQSGVQLIVLGTEDGPVVFNASCPHLGCNVIWDAADVTFRCPCHGAIFSAAGQVVRGPVSAPLAQVPFEIRDEKIIIG